MEEKKVRLERDALASALSVVERIVEPKDKALDPRYGVVLLDVDAAESRLSIVAQNGCQAAISKAQASSEKDFRVAVPGRLLIDYVKALPSGGSATLTPAGKGRKATSLKVESGGHSCVLPAHPSADGFDIPGMDEGDTCRVTVSGELFRSVVQASTAAARQVEASSALAGVHLSAGESALRVSGCDGEQVVIAYVDLSTERDGAANRTSATLPSAALKDLARHVVVGEDVEVMIGKSRAAIVCQAGEFYLQQLASKYPDLEGLIPTDLVAQAVVPNEVFRQSLKAMAVLTRQQYGINPMRIAVEDDAVILAYSGQRQGGKEALASGEVRIASAEQSGGSAYTVVDVGFLAAHAAAVPSGADLHVGVGGPLAPVALRSSFGDDAASARIAYAAMPMAVEEDAD